MIDNHLKEEFQEYQKEKQQISEVIRKAEGRNNSQHKIISAIFVILIVAILILGIILNRLTLLQTLEIATLLAVLKVIWLFYDLQKTMHFQFWLLNSLEFRLNEIDKKARNIERTLKEETK